MAKKVFLGVGHGGSDPGAVGNGLKEKNLNMAIALACGNELARHGVNVMLSRYKDEDDSLTEEINECNAFGPDLAVDIHNNAGGGDGVEAFHTHKGGTGKTLAVNIIAEVVKLGQNSRGAKIKKNEQGNDYYGFIRQTTAPAVIVECAFIDNATDIKIIDTAAEQNAMGIAIAKGILKTLGISLKEEKKETEQKPEESQKPESTGEMYRVQVGAYRNRTNAEAMVGKLKAAGFNAIIVEAGYTNVEKPAAPAKPEVTPDPEKPKKTVDELAREVIRGDWGNGKERVNRLTAAGYDYDAVQERVDAMLR